MAKQFGSGNLTVERLTVGAGNPIAGSSLTVSAVAGAGNTAINSKGVLAVSGNTGIGAAYGSTIGIVSNDTGSTSRVFFGDGTGYSFALSKRVGSVTTDLFKISDSGDINARGVAFAKYASSQQSFTSSTTLANTALQIASIPAGTYAFKTFLPMTAVSTSSMGVKINIAVGGTLSGNNFCAIYGIIDGSSYTLQGFNLSATASFSNVFVGNIDYTIWEGSFTTLTAGYFAVQMAQNVSNANPLVLEDRAYLLVTQLS
jgi:hypothetical protein